MLSAVSQILPLPAHVRERRMNELAVFCAALAFHFKDRLRARHRNNLFSVAAWWSAALYVQGPIVLRRRLTQQHWREAIDLVSIQFLDKEAIASSDEGEDYDDLKAASANAIFRTLQLWKAIFGAVAKPKALLDNDAVFEKLTNAFKHPEYSLADTFLLDSPEEDEHDAGKKSDIDEFCESFTTFFEICARSHL